MTTSDDAAPAADAVATESPSVWDAMETDAAAEEDGRWFKNFFGPGIDADVKLRNLMCTAAINARNRLDARYSKFMINGVYPPEVKDKVDAELLAEAIVVDWRGTAFRNKDNTPLLYSKANAKALLSNMKHFRHRVLVVAHNLDAFRVEVTEQAEKN